MQNRSGNQGHLLAVAGGAGLAVSLWLPWYTVNIPQATLNSLAQASQQWGSLGGLIRSGTALLSQLGPFHLTAWDVFKTVPAVLLVVSIIGGGLALLALNDRAGDTTPLTMLAGAVGVLLVGYRIASPPGSGSFVHPAWGIWLALLSATATLAGGYIGSRARDEGPAVVMPLPNQYVAPPPGTVPPPAA